MPNKKDKFKNVRIVKFLADYAPGANGKVIYKKDSEHAIPVATVEKIQGHGAKIEVSKLDVEALEEKYKRELEGDQIDEE